MDNDYKGIFDALFNVHHLICQIPRIKMTQCFVMIF